MKNEIKFEEMTNNEILKGLKLFSQAIKLNKISYANANPLQQYCYTSSSDVVGVYFPNSQIDYSQPYYEFIAMVKSGNQLGICYTYTSEYLQELTKNATEEGKKHIYERLEQYYFISFDRIIYTNEELNIIEKLKRECDTTRKDIETLKHIKIVYKKDGKPFADISKCVDPNPLENVKISARQDYANSIKIFESVSRISANGYPYNNYNDVTIYGITSAEDILPQVAKSIESKESYIKSLESDIKNIKQVTKAVKQFKQAMSKFSARTREETKANLYWF